MLLVKKLFFFSFHRESGLNVTDPESEDTKLSSGSLAQFYDVAVPADQNDDTADEAEADTTQPSEDEVDALVDSSVENQGDMTTTGQSPTVTDPPTESPATDDIQPVQVVEDNDHVGVDHDPLSEVPTQPSRPAPTPPRPADASSIPPTRPKQPELFEVEAEGGDEGGEENAVPEVSPEDEFPVYDTVEVLIYL